MNNLEKAKKVSLLACDIERHKHNVESIKERYSKWKLLIEESKESYYFTGILFKDKSGLLLDINSDIFEFLLLQEEGRLREKELELDELLNGNLNKIKSIVNKGCDANYGN